MVLKSFIRDGMCLQPVSVEVVLTPGLPVITILGLPDKIIQESGKRIQAALLSQGYQMPKAKTVMVSLHPREIKKSSLGLDLAIALGILHVSGQKLLQNEAASIYGELDMHGNVQAPEDIGLLGLVEGELLTGVGSTSLSGSYSIIRDLRSEPERQTTPQVVRLWQRPPPLYPKYHKEAAEILKIVSAGEHSVVLAGAPGSGKTACVESVASFLAEPTRKQTLDLQKSDYYFRQQNAWRPVIKPHHSTTALAMVGGGSLAQPGEIVRSHQGILILDELLEFSTEVQSILREPMENGTLSLSRILSRRAYECKSLVLATSNLCPCGEYLPQTLNRCRCSSLQLRRYLQKLSGPFVDRFAILQFTSTWKKQKSEEVSAEQILKEVTSAICFRQEVRQQEEPNGDLLLPAVVRTLAKNVDVNNLPQFSSRRREIFFWRVARTIADLGSSENITSQHIERSLFLTYFPFEEIKKIFE